MENSSSTRKIQKHLEDVEMKVLRMQSYESCSDSVESKRISEKSSGKADEEIGSGRKVEVKGIPGAAEQLVMKAIQERCYWSAKKKLESGSGRWESPGGWVVNNFYSPEECPSKDLHDRLVKKGLNFMPRSVSSYKRQG